VRAERWLQLVAVLVGCGLAGRAHAYCRTTTCDPETEVCATDARDCVIDGLPLFWPDACLTVWTPSSTEPLPGVDDGTFAALTQAAYDAWRDVRCDGFAPRIDVAVGGSLQCLTKGAEADDHDRVNAVSVVSENWPHPAALGEIAITTVSFIPSTGEIVDADIELNAVQRTFSTDDDPVDADLLSALTHEAGHALGLAHSDDREATMYPETHSNTRLRTLESDDEEGICEIYWPNDDSPVCRANDRLEDPNEVCAQIDARASALTRTPSGCSGCSVPGSTRAHAAPWALLFASIAWLRWKRRRGARSRAA